MKSVGIIGLGIMGSAYARNLIAAGITVAGVDPAPEARQRLKALGGTPHEGPGEWLADCDLVILSLLSPTVMQEVCESLADLLRPGQVVLETGTFRLDDKIAAYRTLATRSIHLLDCPVSGTGAQAKDGDILMMASGDSDKAESRLEKRAHLVPEPIKPQEPNP